VFEPSPSTLLASLKSPWARADIAMSKSWFHDKSPRCVSYAAHLVVDYEIDNADFVQDCIQAARREKYPFVPSCGSFLSGAEFVFHLCPGSVLMQLTEPQPPVAPEEIKAIVVTNDSPYWNYSWGWDDGAGGEVDIWGFQMLTNWHHAYRINSGMLRLERTEESRWSFILNTEGRRWRFIVNLEAVPVPESEDLLKKYNLWAESIRFSASCECDVGSYHTECVGD